MHILNVKIEKGNLPSDALIDEHIKWVKQAFASMQFIVAGPKGGQPGGYIVTKSMPENEISDLVSRDPFVVAGVADYEILSFDVAFMQPMLESIV